MEIKRIKAALAGLVIMGLTFTACGDDGEQGPAGPAGAAGNANVEASTYDVPRSNWSQVQGGLSDTLIVPEITADVVTNGTVQVFHSRDTSSAETRNWTALPYSNSIVNYTYSYDVNQVILGVNLASQQTITGLNVDLIYKVVVIPSAAMIDGVDIKDYEQVQSVYGIQELDM